MAHAIPILTDDDLRACPRGDDDGFGALRTARGLLPLVAMEVDAEITGLVAELRVAQTFVNPTGEPVEATYVFPLPDRAGVTEFKMEVAGRVVLGILKERGAARADYQRAVAAGQRAAITEEDRPGTFTMQVGNLMPGERATVHLALTGPVLVDGGEATFRFPLVVAPRYIPGRALDGASVGDGTAVDTDAVPDASRISPPILLPGHASPVRLGLRATVRSMGLAIANLRSSLHVVDVATRDGASRFEVALRPGERLDRDFVLRWSVGADAVSTGLVLSPDADRPGEGTFLLALVPPAGEGDRPRDVVFVLDRSGSMRGWKMVAARRAVARMVDTLRPTDRFALTVFDNVTERPPAMAELTPATDRSRFRAVEWLAGVDARGGTELALPIQQAVRELAGGALDRDKVMVLVTDGQVGNEDQILRGIGADAKNVRIFTLGIDRAVNEGFLKRLALLGGGFSEIVESEERLDEVMGRIHAKIATPALTELDLTGIGITLEASTFVPRRLPAVFLGTPALIAGRYRGREDGAAIWVRGIGRRGEPTSVTVAAEVGRSRAMTTLWARGAVRDLEDEFAIGRGDRGALERKIVETALRFGVLCRFVAYVAVDQEVVNRTGTTRKLVQPVETPSGWGLLDAMSPGAPPAPRASRGGRARRAPAAKPGPASAAEAPPPPSPAPAPSFEARAAKGEAASARPMLRSREAAKLDASFAESSATAAPGLRGLVEAEVEPRPKRAAFTAPEPVASPWSAPPDEVLRLIEAEGVRRSESAELFAALVVGLRHARRALGDPAALEALARELRRRLAELAPARPEASVLDALLRELDRAGPRAGRADEVEARLLAALRGPTPEVRGGAFWK